MKEEALHSGRSESTMQNKYKASTLGTAIRVKHTFPYRWVCSFQAKDQL